MQDRARFNLGEVHLSISDGYYSIIVLIASVVEPQDT